MTDPHKLSDQAIEHHLAGLDQWSVKDAKLHREYRFADFVEAFGFMAKAALIAQAMDHHPQWFNVYSTVVIDLTTHDAGGITEKDFELAKQMERLASV